MINPFVSPGTAVAAVASLLFGSAPSAFAAAEVRKSYDLPRGDAGDTLKRFAAESDRQVIYLVDLVRGVATNAVRGEFTAREALRRMIADTVLVVAEDETTGALMIHRPSPASPPQKSPAQSAQEVKRKNPLALLSGWFALTLTPTLSAQLPVGSIEGRVYNVTSGTFLNNARVSVEAFGLAAFTNERGEFLLNQVPAGQAKVRVFFTGLETRESVINVSAGVVARQDFELTVKGVADEEKVVSLNAFVVASMRETNASAIAINEQRFAPNIKNVVSADEFGDVSEGNLGEFVKYLPGVTVDGNSWDVRSISVRGFSSNYTAVTMDGNRAASAASSSADRGFEVSSGLSMNNVARVEVTKSPLPDTPADTLGGSVNVVSKNAFERKTAQFTYRVYGNLNLKEPGVGKLSGYSPKSAARETEPGLDFSYVAPLTRRFGITLSGLHTRRYNDVQQLDPFWLPIRGATAFATPDNPFMSRATYKLAPTYVKRTSVSLGSDWKASERDVISAGVSFTTTDTHQDIPTLDFNAIGAATTRPISFGPTFTAGAANAGRAESLPRYRRKLDRSLHARLSWRHDGPVWTALAGAAVSRSTNVYRDIDYNLFAGATLRLNAIALRFDDIAGSTPGRISATTANGVAVDVFDVKNYSIIQTTSTPLDGLDSIHSASASVQRTVGRIVPLIVKLGADVRRQTRDLRGASQRWNFVGPDRIAGTADDRVGNYDLLLTNGYGDGKFSFGLPRTTWVDLTKLWELYRRNPSYFSLDEANAIQANATNSRRIVETVSAGYFRADMRLLQNRLWLAGGVRFERTEDEGSGIRDDIRATYQKDSAGNLIRNSQGQLVRVTTDAVALARLRFIDRGTQAERSYDHLFPSINATYSLRDNLLARAAYAKTIGRPNFSVIIPGITISDPTAASPVINLTSPELKPWTADNFDLSLEYYTKNNGLVSAGVFAKEVSDFFGQTRYPVSPEILAEHGLTGDYSSYEVVQMKNSGKASITGFELNFRQSLNFLSAWTRGVQVFANTTALHTSGDRAADFSGFVPRSTNLGISLSRLKYNVKLNWNYQSRISLNAVTGAGVASDTVSYRNPRNLITFNFDCRISRRLVLFGVINNVLGKPRVNEAYGAATPGYARVTNINHYGSQSSFGIKGEF